MALIRCDYALSEWREVLKRSTNIRQDHSKFRDVAHLVAKASMHLGQWGVLTEYIPQIDENYDDKTFYQAVFKIDTNEFEEAIDLISQSRKNLLNSMVGLNANTYHNSYETMVRLQQLYEMEEIIDFKKFEKDAKSDMNKYFLSTSSIEETIQ